VRTALAEAGFTTRIAAATGDPFAGLDRHAVALAVLDARLAIGRAEAISWLHGEHIPVVCLAPSSAGADPASVLELGADDVLREPFSPRELVARVKAVLRGYERARAPSDTIDLGPITVDRRGRHAAVRGRRLTLTRSELELLSRLVASPGRVFNRDELLAAITLPGKRPSPRLIDTHVVSLRRKLGPAGEWIETVRGYGYRARADHA